MTPPPSHRDPLDAAIRAHLDAEAAKVDARRVLARVKAAQSATVPSTHRRPWLRWVLAGSGAAIAACLLIGLFLTGNTPTPEKTLSAEELVKEAKSVHESAPADRCYEWSADWELAPFFRRFRFQPIRQGTVWTRGDQFVMLLTVDAGPPLVMGQEPTGRVWVAPTRRHAIVYDKDELNDPLARFCELMSLRVVSTLGEVLEKYDLFRKDDGATGQPIRIEATLRPRFFPGARFRKVELELDPTTKVVRKAVLHRFTAGEADGTLTFTLSETGRKPDDFYGVKGHTDANAVIHDGRPLPNTPRAKMQDELLKRLQNRQK